MSNRERKAKARDVGEIQASSWPHPSRTPEESRPRTGAPGLVWGCEWNTATPALSRVVSSFLETGLLHTLFTNNGAAGSSLARPL